MPTGLGAFSGHPLAHWPECEDCAPTGFNSIKMMRTKLKTNAPFETLNPITNGLSRTSDKINRTVFTKLLDHKTKPFDPCLDSPLVGYLTKSTLRGVPLPSNFQNMNRLINPTKQNIQLPKRDPHKRCLIIPNWTKPLRNLSCQRTTKKSVKGRFLRSKVMWIWPFQSWNLPDTFALWLRCFLYNSAILVVSNLNGIAVANMSHGEPSFISGSDHSSHMIRPKFPEALCSMLVGTVSSSVGYMIANADPRVKSWFISFSHSVSWYFYDLYTMRT